MNRAQKGMSLLETTLALTLMAGFMTGLFMLFRSQQQTVTTVVGEFKGARQAMQPLSLISQELANARSLTAIATSSISYTSIVDNGATARQIALAPAIAADPRLRPLRLDLGSGALPISSERLIQNHNPLAISLRRRDGSKATTPVSLFTYLDAAGNPTALLANVRRIEIYMVIQSKPESPPRYLTTTVFLRNIP